MHGFHLNAYQTNYATERRNIFYSMFYYSTTIMLSFGPNKHIFQYLNTLSTDVTDVIPSRSSMDFSSLATVLSANSARVSAWPEHRHGSQGKELALTQ